MRSRLRTRNRSLTVAAGATGEGKTSARRSYLAAMRRKPPRRPDMRSTALLHR